MVRSSANTSAARKFTNGCLPRAGEPHAEYSDMSIQTGYYNIPIISASAPTQCLATAYSTHQLSALNKATSTTRSVTRSQDIELSTTCGRTTSNLLEAVCCSRKVTCQSQNS